MKQHLAKVICWAQKRRTTDPQYESLKYINVMTGWPGKIRGKISRKLLLGASVELRR